MKPDPDNIVPFIREEAVDFPELDAAEIFKLKKLLRYIEIDENQNALVIKNGKSRILAREDGTIRIEGEKVTHASQGTLFLSAAIIEIN